MIELSVPAPVSSFLEAYELARSTLSKAGHPDTNFTITDTSGNVVTLQTVQQGGDFIIVPGSVISNPPQAYVFARYKNERSDPRGNRFPQLLPKFVTPSLVNDMYEQHGAFQATCNIIAALNTSVSSTAGPHTIASLMRTRIIDSSSITPKSGDVRQNPRPIIARPAQILAGQEQVFDAEIDRRMKEYFSEEGYGIDPHVEVEGSGSDSDPLRVSYRMSDVDQFYDNHRLSANYQVSTDLFNRFCHYVLSPYLVHTATVDNFIRHLTTEIVPSLNRLAEEGRSVGLSETPAGGTSRIAQQKLSRRYSRQLKYLLQRLATDPKDFYYGKDMALMAHPVFLIPHMQYILLPPPHVELEGVEARHRLQGRGKARRKHITRAERLLNEAGEPPKYTGDGTRIIKDYTPAEGGGHEVVTPLHHLAAVGPGTAAFDWTFLQERLSNMDVAGILDALFLPMTRDEVQIESHRVEDYVEAARRLYGRARSARDNLAGSAAGPNFRLTRTETPPRGYRQTGEMTRPPYVGNYTETELNRMSAVDVKNLAVNITGDPDNGNGTKPVAVTAIIDYQNANPLVGITRDNALELVVSDTALMFEIDLPGLHPMPVGWPEELVFAMMETLAKYKDQITGLNGQAFSREEFLSPSINSNFTFDPDAEIEMSWYDTSSNRQRRYGLSYSRIRQITQASVPVNNNGMPNEDQVREEGRTNARAAYALLMAADGITPDAVPIELTEAVQAIYLYGGKANLADLQNSDFAPRFRGDLEPADEALMFDLIPGANKQLWPEAGNDDLVHAENRFTFIRNVVTHYIDAYFHVAQTDGQGLISLNVSTNDGLSSLFILRETLRQARQKYNYIASADDTAFIYHLMIWQLENCLGATTLAAEKASIGGLFKNLWKSLSDRGEDNIANVFQQAVAENNIDELNEAIHLQNILEALG